jgi:hypothetical protein
MLNKNVRKLPHLYRSYFVISLVSLLAVQATGSAASEGCRFDGQLLERPTKHRHILTHKKYSYETQVGVPYGDTEEFPSWAKGRPEYTKPVRYGDRWIYILPRKLRRTEKLALRKMDDHKIEIIEYKVAHRRTTQVNGKVAK